VANAVTDTDTATTICRKGGYTTSIRPPESLTEPAKRKLLAAYGIPAAHIGNYELEHLIDLAGGGALLGQFGGEGVAGAGTRVAL
jgi:hypothetical protein